MICISMLCSHCVLYAWMDDAVLWKPGNQYAFTGIYKFLVQTCLWWFYKYLQLEWFQRNLKLLYLKTLKQSDPILYMCCLTDMACPHGFCDLYIAANLYRIEILPLTQCVCTNIPLNSWVLCQILNCCMFFFPFFGLLY